MGGGPRGSHREGTRVQYSQVTLPPSRCCLVAQAWLSLWEPVSCSPPGSPVHGFFRQGYWTGLPFPSPGDFAD